MKLGRISTGILAATIAASSLVTPVANADEAEISSEFVTNSSLLTGLWAIVEAPVVGALMLSSIFSPGCHMMNTPACHE